MSVVLRWQMSSVVLLLVMPSVSRYHLASRGQRKEPEKTQSSKRKPGSFLTPALNRCAALTYDVTSYGRLTREPLSPLTTMSTTLDLHRRCREQKQPRVSRCQSCPMPYEITIPHRIAPLPRMNALRHRWQTRPSEQLNL
jgi:hypothetical protein